MKTVKVKVRPLGEVAAKIEQILKEQEWLWNECLKLALHNHCLEWYKWAGKRARDKNHDFYGADLEGIIRTPLRFSQRGAWLGAACQIAQGGPYWKKDESLVIEYQIQKNQKWTTARKHGYKLVPGDKPYERIWPVQHEFKLMNGKALKKVSDLDRMNGLNAARALQNLPFLTPDTSTYVGGTIQDFETAWKAYLDVNLVDRKRPLWKDGKQRRLLTLSNPQRPPNLKRDMIKCSAELQFQPLDKSWLKRLGDLKPRSYKITTQPSGTYICISAALQSESRKPTLEKKLEKIGADLKKQSEALGHSKAEAKEFKETDPLYIEASEQLSLLEDEILMERLATSPCRKRTGLIAGVDPGVKAIVATDHDALFTPNLARGRVEVHIEELQQRLDTMRNCNDKRLGKVWKKGEREATQNEQRLQHKIRRLHEKAKNSSSAFNHKLSTRLARTYDVIGWENTQLKNMSKTATPVLAESGTHYEKNNAAAKTGLNHALRTACLGDLKAKTKQKMEAAQKQLKDSPAPNSSKKCHACDAEGDRRTQAIFVCLNPACCLHGVEQQADVNAARNHKKAIQ